MLQWIGQLGPVQQSLLATLFTWGVTALGASLVYFFRSINKKVLNGMLGFAAGVMIMASFDELVDFILTRDGMVGAELSGAGLGGCIITLVRRDCAEDLLAALKRGYCGKSGLPMGVQPCFPVLGSMVFGKEPGTSQ